jgi:hypothetical protein
MFDPLVLDPLTVGTATGIGHSFGQRLFAWASRLWNRTRQGTATTEPTTEETLEQEVLAADMVVDLQKIETEKDYQQFVDGLQASGIPVDASTAEQLRALQTEVLGRAASLQTLKSLADIAAEALQRVGVEPVDLRRWQSLAERLTESGPATDSSPTTATPHVPVDVATAKRPSTFWVWNRQEVDRRLTTFIKRVVQNCRAACDEFLSSGDDMSALRKVRELRERLDVIHELLTTTPTFAPETRALRLDGKKTKELIVNLEQGVTSAETLADGTRKLLERSPAATEWLSSADACLRAAASLNHDIRMRRSVR